MRWKGRASSTNVEDRRGSGVRGRGRGMAAGGIGIGTVIVVIIVALMSGDPSALLEQASQPDPHSTYAESPPTQSAEEDEMAEFVSVVLKDTEDAWDQIFREQLHSTYHKPIMVIFSGSVSSACGLANAATGPFYCPGDEKLYIDLSFYNELSQKLGAPGDFAMAYVIAHEVGHHVQNLMGTLEDVNRSRRRLSEAEANQMSVKLELQADFYAGVWARYTQEMKHVLEAGDLEEAIRAAEAVGDDRLQKQARGYVVPESFTHGTSAQRMRWYQKGYQTGDLSAGDTFKARSL
ncbi:MAG: neutral zinc metallopeptidase [Bacteroidia bacterium]|nr:neutral zinc metallopeptidase [Bacteroidia bacterium]